MLAKERLIEIGKLITPQWLEDQRAACIRKIAKNMERYGQNFPSASAMNGKYRLKANDDWTNGFWTGMLWLAYEWTKDDAFLKRAEENLDSFQQRLTDHFVLDHHDIGFLYSLSAGAGYQITHKEAYKNQLLQAADVLLARFQEKGGFLQAWGKLNDPGEYRLIIDSLINLPLLFQASELSGNPRYAEVAKEHYHTLINTVIKPDGTTYHTYYFDPATGAPSHGATHQGHGDQSIWARGQSWGVLGIPLNERYVHSQPYPSIYRQIVDVFLANLPQDLVPYWDFDFNDEHPAEKDSSALAIAACGLIEASQQEAYPDALALAKGMVYQLANHYFAEEEENEGLLLHGVYAHGEGKGVDEPNLWGDYFYFEALTRLSNPDWEIYW